ncbi:MAG: hypothetical protein ACRDV9_14110, partial [Acidimicrobiia bacterium]
MFDRWWEHALGRYLSLDADGSPEWVALYYDPIVDHLHRSRRGGYEAGLALTLYLGPHRPETAETIYRWAMAGLGWSDPTAPPRHQLEDPRLLCLGIALSKEFGDTPTHDHLHRHAQEHFEPTWDQARGEFAYRFGLDEPYPRGQPNALLMLAEIGSESSWWRVFNRSDPSPLAGPTVAGVDHSRLGIAQAFYDRHRSALAVSTSAGIPPAQSSPTSFNVELFPGAADAVVRCDGMSFENWRVTGENRISIDTTVGDHDFWIEHPS